MVYSNKNNISGLVFEYRIINVIIFIGILLPIVQFIFNRSLWTDEASLALNILNASYLELLKPLDTGHAAPIIFLFSEKFFSILIPNSDYGLRIVPLLSYFASLFFFYKILQQIFNNTYTTIFALSLFVFNATLINYSNEAKQYMCDVFVITSIYHIILKKYNKVENKYYLLGIIGALSFFLSHITPIILLSCGIYLVYVDCINKNLKLKYIIGLLLVWTLTFLLYYYFFVYKHPAAENFKGYWLKMNTFMPINPLNIDFYQFHFDKIKMIFSQLISVGNIGRYFLAILYLVGFSCLIYKRNFEIIILLFFPIFIHLLISAFELYPFDLRLILYIIPTIIIVAAYGFEYFNEMIFKDLKIDRLRFLSILIPFSILSVTPWYAFPLKKEEIKKSIDYIEDNIADENKIYVYKGALNAYKYYDNIEYIKFSNSVIFGKGTRADKSTYIEQLINLRGNIWLLFSHNYNNEEEYIITQLDSLGYNRIETFKTNGSSTYLYDFGD